MSIIRIEKLLRSVLPCLHLIGITSVGKLEIYLLNRSYLQSQQHLQNFGQRDKCVLSLSSLNVCNRSWTEEREGEREREREKLIRSSISSCQSLYLSSHLGKILQTASGCCLHNILAKKAPICFCFLITHHQNDQTRKPSEMKLKQKRTTTGLPKKRSAETIN